MNSIIIQLAARKTYVEAISCACLDFEEDPSQCFNLPKATIGAARLCPGGPDSSITVCLEQVIYFEDSYLQSSL